MPTGDFPDRKYLINARELGERLGAVTLIDLRPAEDFALGHIAGSKHLDIYGISLNDSSDAPLNAFLSIFQTLFGTRGVSQDKPVVIYDHETGERAARAVWLLAVLGHPDVRILDGGTQAWIASGKRLVHLTEAPAPVDAAKAPPTPPPYKGTPNLGLLATRFMFIALSTMNRRSLSMSGASPNIGARKNEPGALEPFRAPCTSSGAITWTTTARFDRRKKSAISTSQEVQRQTRPSSLSVMAATARPTHSSPSSPWAIRASATMWHPGQNGEIEMIRRSSSRTRGGSGPR